MALVAPPSPRTERVENVLLQLKDQSSCQLGTLLLTSHHLIFEPANAKQPTKHRFPYSLIFKATKLPSLRKLGTNSRIFPLTIHQKDFDAFALGFATEAIQLDVFESLKQCAVILDATQLYAFHNKPTPPLNASDKPGQAGWQIYDFKREFARQGIGSRTKAWRFTDVNAQYTFCPTYPALMVVPSRISDTTLNYAAKYRSKCRIPALTYLHWANHGSITRSSQPMVGLKNARSIQDEKLIEAIFSSHHFADPNSMAAKAAAEASASANPGSAGSTFAVYGATSTNLIVDARPTANAMVMVARGAGTENMEYYKGCKKTYLGIDNIHVMRDSINRLTDALRESEPAATFGMQVEPAADPQPESGSESATGQAADPPTLRATPEPVDANALRRSSWLKHISNLLEGSMTIVRNIHINSSHVLIHCSDGWDRTSQLASISEICLDPYYRTFEGLAVLIEKDWLSFGFQFAHRHGLKGNEKCFVTASRHHTVDDEDDRASDLSDGEASEAPSQAAAAATAFWGFTKQLTANFASGASSAGPTPGSPIRETSPVFHQFLDCVWQLQRQFPTQFEYNDEFLVELFRVALESCFGTFLHDSERQRLEGPPRLPSVTASAWDYLLAPAQRARFANASYRPAKEGTDEGVLLADPREVRYFARMFKRDHAEMNGPLERQAEERQRARERLERVVKGGADPLSPPAAPAAASSGHGAVDVAHGKIDPTQLSYEVRKPRAPPQPQSPAPAPAPASAIPVDAPLPSQQGAGAANAGAGAGVKNMLLGGWGRLQEAVAGPAPEPWSLNAPATPPAPAPAAAAAAPRPAPSGTHNPWATDAWRHEMEVERERMNGLRLSSRTACADGGTQGAAAAAAAGTGTATKGGGESDPLGVLGP